MVQLSRIDVTTRDADLEGTTLEPQRDVTGRYSDQDLNQRHGNSRPDRN